MFFQFACAVATPGERPAARKIAPTRSSSRGPAVVSVLALAPNAARQPMQAVNAASGTQASPQIVVPGGYVPIYGTVLALGDTPLPLSYACPPQVNGLIPQGLIPHASYQLVVVRELTIYGTGLAPWWL
jgi:hypothetical protein